MSAKVSYLYDKKEELNELMAYFDPQYINNKCYNLKQCGGRGQTLLFTNENGRGLVLRHYFRGGLIGKFLKDSFFLCEQRAHRAFDEYQLLSWMYDQGLAVPKPVIAREIKQLLYIKQDIVIEQIDDSLDLAHIICDRYLTDAEFANIGKCIGKMFALNVDHTDLNIRNILLDKSGKVYLIDFDKCFRCVLTAERKRAILERLLRSFNKELVVSTKKCYFEPKAFDILVSSALSA